MADRTELNGEQLQQIAKKFQLEADEMNNLLSQTKNKVDALHGTGWIGRGADEFYDEMQTLMFPAFQRLVDALTNASGKVNDILKIFEDAQAESQGYFKFE